jgi:glutaredoxin
MTNQQLAKPLLFTQPGCLSCELIRFFLEAKEISFDERDISTDPTAKRAMTEEHGSHETPTLVIFFEHTQEVVVGFSPVRLEELLDQLPFPASSEPVIPS